MSTLTQDLDYIKDLAERGETAPLVGGRFALWWGVLTAAMLGLHWMALTGRTPFPIDAIGAFWIGYAIIGGIGTALLATLVKDPAGVSSVNNRLANMVWSTIGVPIGLYTFGVFLGVAFGAAPLAAFDTILGVAFACYTIAFYAVGRFSRDRVMLGFAAICAAATIISGLLIGQSVLYLVAAGFVLATAGVSGIYQMARAPRTTV